MNIALTCTGLDGVLLIEPEMFTDERGFFYESYSSARFAEHGLQLTFVQDNHSRSRDNVIRGLHYQGPAGPQWRLVRCTVGEIYDVVVDLRVGSSTLGKWIGVRLSAHNKHQLLIPPPFAHGFAVLKGPAEVQYKCSGPHNPRAERTLFWGDADVGIDWPLVGAPVVSIKDSQAPSFADYLADPDFPEGSVDQAAVLSGVP